MLNYKTFRRKSSRIEARQRFLRHDTKGTIHIKKIDKLDFKEKLSLHENQLSEETHTD